MKTSNTKTLNTKTLNTKTLNTKTLNTKTLNTNNKPTNPLNASYSTQVKSALKKDPAILEQQQGMLEQIPTKKQTIFRKKQNKIKKQKNTGIVIFTNKVISWKNSLDLVIRIGLIAIATLAILLGLFFKTEISKSHAHWNIMWLLNMNKYNHKSNSQTFFHTNAFLIVSIIYVIGFILPLTIFSKKRLFTIFFIVYAIGIAIWSIFACLGFLKYHTFKNHKAIASLEFISLSASWTIFALLLLKLIKYKKHFKNQQQN